MTNPCLATLYKAKALPRRTFVAQALRSVKPLALLTAVLSLLAAPSGLHAVRAEALHADRIGSMSCSGGGLTLVLRPGIVPPANADWNKPAARDIPPGAVIERFPLYPGAAPSSATMPAHAVGGILPAYRKVARAEFQVPAGYQAIYYWYLHALSACGLVAEGTTLWHQPAAPAFAGLQYISTDWLTWLNLIFRPLSPTTTAVLYVAQALDLPPRPATSFLHGPFESVSVLYQTFSVIPGGNRTYRFTITWPATIARIVNAIDGPTRIWVPVGAGGTVLFSQSAVLSLLRRDGGVRRVSVGGGLDRIIVGRTRPLVDLNGRVIKLVARIAHRRCRDAASS